jgi:prophage antirepressor-like protein
MKSKNQIQAFHSKEFGALDILLIDGKPYFPATECAVILGYKNPQKAIRDHCKGVNESFTPSVGGVQKKNFIPEGDLYRLIIRSKLPAAERFEKWVFDEVLPTIRKYGAYAVPETLDEMIRSPEFTAALTRKLDAERKKSAALMELAEEMAPKALYCALILQSKNALPITLIAKEYGLSAKSFNALLYALGIQYKVSGVWVLYQPYAGRGYTVTHTYITNDNEARLHTCWTQKGRLFLYETLRNHGFPPLIERRTDRH